MASSPSPSHLPPPTAPIRPPVPTAPRGRNQLALTSMLLALVFPLGVALDIVLATLTQHTPSLAVGTITEAVGTLLAFVSPPAIIGAIVTGHIALGRAKHYSPWHARRGLAWTGLVVGYLSLAVFIGFWALLLTGHGF